jgi:hypothetical protein
LRIPCVLSKQYNCQIDSGSSDLLIPSTGLNNYNFSSPTYNTTSKTPLTGRLSGATFADGSAWNGYFYGDYVTLAGTLKGLAPFAVVTRQVKKKKIYIILKRPILRQRFHANIFQTTNPVMDGTITQGLIGIAYDSLATSGIQPATVLTSLLLQNVITRDIVGFRGCPATSSIPSVIDWGNDDRNLTCGGLVGWVKVVDRTHYTVNVVGLAVSGTWLALPTRGWQEGLNNRSIVDSCTTIMYIPQFLYQVLMEAVVNSGVFNNLRGLSETNINNFLYDLYSLPAVS